MGWRALLVFCLLLAGSLSAEPLHVQPRALPSGEAYTLWAHSRQHWRAKETPAAPVGSDLVNAHELLALFELQDRDSGREEWSAHFLLQRSHPGAVGVFQGDNWQPGPAQHGRYRVTLSDQGKHFVDDRTDAPVSGAAADYLRAFYSGRGSAKVIAEAMAGPWQPGEQRSLSAEVAAAFGLASGHWRYLHKQTLWHTPVAYFEIHGETLDDGGLFGDVSARGELIVDADNGRPLWFSRRARHAGPVAVSDDFPHGAGLMTQQRAWRYSDVANQGLRIELMAQVEPLGEIRGVRAVGGDSQMLAISSTTDDVDDERATIGLWHLPTRQNVWRAASGTHLGGHPDAAMLFSHDDLGFLNNYQVSSTSAGRFGGYKPDLNHGPPVAVLAAGVYPLKVFADGSLLWVDPGYGHHRHYGKGFSINPVAAAISRDGRRIAALDSGGVVEVRAITYSSMCDETAPPLRFCDAVTARVGEPLAGFSVDPAQSIRLDASGERVLLVGEGLARVMDLQGEELEQVAADWADFSPADDQLISSQGNTGSADITPDGRLLAQARQDRVALLDVGTGSEVHSIESRVSPVLGMLPLPGEGRLVTLTHEGLFRWDLPALSVAFEPLAEPPPELATLAGTELAEQELQQVLAADALALADGGRVLLARDGQGRLHETRYGIESPLPADTAGAFRAVYDRQGNQLYLLHVNGRITAWQWDDGWRRRAQLETAATGDQGHLALSADGDWLAVSHRRDQSGFWNPSIPLVQVLPTSLASVQRDLSPVWSSLTSLAFSEDSELLLAGDDNGRLLLWDVPSGVLVSQFPAHQRRINHLHVEGGRLWSSSDDGGLRLWDINSLVSPGVATADLEGALLKGLGVQRTPHLLATLVATDDEDFSVALPDGFYMATPGALTASAFLYDGEVFDYRAFDLWLNRPDLVMQRLKLGEPRQWSLLAAARERRVASFGVEDAMPDLRNTRVPDIGLDKLPSVVDRPEVLVSARVIPGSAPLSRVQLYINGVLQHSEVVNDGAGGALPFQHAVTLSAGLNRLEIRASDTAGQTGFSEPRFVLAQHEAPPPTLRVLAVGVSDYHDSSLDLRFAAKDARDLGDLLGRVEGDHEAVEIRYLLDREVTRENIQREAAILRDSHVDDIVVIFLAGHGFLDEQQAYYFATTDTDPRDPAARGLSWQGLAELIEAIPSRRRLILLDTCHSGEVDAATDQPVPVAGVSGVSGVGFRGLGRPEGRGVMDASIAGLNQYFAALRNDTGAIVMAAAGGLEYAYEADQWANGVFTYSLLEGLGQGSAAGAQGVVTVQGLKRYVNRRVVELTAGGQRPVARDDSLEIDFALGRSR